MVVYGVDWSVVDQSLQFEEGESAYLVDLGEEAFAETLLAEVVQSVEARHCVQEGLA